MRDQRSIFRGELRRLHLMWREWDSYIRLGGPDKEALERLTLFKADLCSRIGESRIKDKAPWFARVEAACAPAVKRTRTARATRDADRGADGHPPIWRGASDDGPPRRVVGVVWSRKVGRWAIRIVTKMGEYWDTDTEGVSLLDLAMDVDEIRVAFTIRGFFSARPGLRNNIWNEPASAKAMMFSAEQSGQFELNRDNPRCAHAAVWLQRKADWEADNASAFRSGRLPSSFRTVPKVSSIVDRISRDAPAPATPPILIKPA